jgi:2-methylcitrate dehydratase PrpD
MTAAQSFASYATSLRHATLDPEVVHHAKRAIVDWFAALLPGSVAPPSTLLEKALQEDLDRGGARLALGRAATVRTAALINGTAAHTVEVDDIYREAIFHPGAPTIAAALAIAQARNATGMQLLRGVIAGYEVSTRIGAALGRDHYRYWHNTGTVGTFGAVSAAATLLGLDETRHAHALCTGATFAAGLQQAFRMDSMSKPLHAGHAAEAGVLAALAAEQGVTGSLDVLDGEAGMGRAMSQAPDWDLAVATLGREFHITRMTFKNHACCGHTFAPIDGALELRQRMGVRWQDLTAIEVATYGPALDVAGNFNPRTAAEARFSIPFVVATALIHGTVRLSAFTDERLKDADIRTLMSRIRLSVDPELDDCFPRRRAAHIVFTASNGQASCYLQPTRKGDPEQPLTDKDLSEKFMELTSPVVGSERAQKLLQVLWSLDTCEQLLDL